MPVSPKSADYSPSKSQSGSRRKAGTNRKGGDKTPYAPPFDPHDFSDLADQNAQGERLQKVLANAGVASRRHSEKLIISGRVKVNGQVVRELGTRVDPERVLLHVDNRPVLLRDDHLTVALNKPVGIESTMQEKNNTLAAYAEQYSLRLYHVGRLDRDTSGLILLTNNGELAHRLTHPSWEVEKVYLATVKGRFTGKHARALKDGVQLEDGLAQVDQVSIKAQEGGKTLVQLTLHSGKNRVVRRMLEAVGTPVIDLSRLSFGPISLGKLQSGQTRPLKKTEIAKLMEAVGL